MYLNRGCTGWMLSVVDQHSNHHQSDLGPEIPSDPLFFDTRRFTNSVTAHLRDQLEVDAIFPNQDDRKTEERLTPPP